MNTLLTFTFKSQTGKVSTGSFTKIKSLIESNTSYPFKVIIESTINSKRKTVDVISNENGLDIILKIILEEALNMLSRDKYDLACASIWMGESRSTLEAKFIINDGDIENPFALNTSKVEWPLMLDPISFYVFCLFRNITGCETTLIKSEI